jgi:hypothetical protein
MDTNGRRFPNPAARLLHASSLWDRTASRLPSLVLQVG